MALSSQNKKIDLVTQVENKLKTVYDPEFPMVDLFTLGLIYKVEVDEKEKQVQIVMTFTTPACPMAEMIQEMIKNAINEILPKYEVLIEISFEPLWTYKTIKDEDLQRMFE